MIYGLHLRCPRRSCSGLPSWPRPSRAVTTTSEVTFPPGLPTVWHARLPANDSLFKSHASLFLRQICPSSPCSPGGRPCTPPPPPSLSLELIFTRPPCAQTARPIPVVSLCHCIWGPFLAIASCCPGTAITKHHELGGLKREKLHLITVLEARSEGVSGASLPP